LNSTLEANLSDVEGRILVFLRGRRRGATAKFIAVKVGGSFELVRRALERLLTYDAIERRGKFFRVKGRRRPPSRSVAQRLGVGSAEKKYLFA
jgi:hypothetical protein